MLQSYIESATALSTQKIFTNVGMAKCFSKMFRNEGVPFNYLQSEIKVMSRCLSVPDATSLHNCLQNHHQYFTILS